MFKFITLSLCLSFSAHVLADKSGPDMTEIMKQLSAKRDTIKGWAPLCEDGSLSHGFCPFGDMAIFAGISCLAGEADRCDDVKRSQGPDGRWWRSPQMVGDESHENSFSRDQAKGVLAYLVATKDVSAALRWQAYIEANNKRLCPNATDTRCKITMGISQLFGATWDYLGLKKAKWMNRGSLFLSVYSPIEALVQPADYPMHLTGISVWVRREIERRGGVKPPRYEKKITKILARREPKNPFFLLLKKGPTKEVSDLILEKCPDQRPEAEALDWAWQRSQKDQPPIWLKASGHDCVFIINAFENELKNR